MLNKVDDERKRKKLISLKMLSICGKPQDVELEKGNREKRNKNY